MKRLTQVFVCLLSISLNSAAQTAQTFDLATFQPPQGWERQDKQGVLIFTASNEQRKAYGMIMLYGSGDSSGNAKSDFEADWQQFIAGQLKIESKPEIEPPVNVEGWEVTTGAAPFENEMGKAAVILSTYSGYGKTFTVAALFNSKDYLPAIEAFAGSIKLRKPEAKLTQSPASNDGSASIVGTWGVASSDQSTYAQSNGIVGYIRKQYTFNADGTYLFFSKSFQMVYNKMLLIRQSGTYQISGNNLTVIPKTSVIEAWSKKGGVDAWGSRLSSEPYPLEKVTYQFTKHYFSGIQTWSLVLQSSTPTRRDGPFVVSSSFQNAWIYSPPCEQCFIKLPN